MINSLSESEIRKLRQLLRTIPCNGVTTYVAGEGITIDNTTCCNVKEINADITTAYTTIEEEGIAFPQRHILNFTGGGVLVSDISGVTTVNIAQVPSGLTYKGPWDANANSPLITSGVGTPGDYYIVNVAGTTNIDGITDWQVGDWIIYDTTVWFKIDNHDVQCYNTVKEESTTLPQRSVLKFVGLGVTASDVAGETVVTITEGLPATNYGLFAQTANSPTITATTVEGTLIDGGVGTLSVPANGFFVGASFRADFGGLMSAKNNDTIRIRIKVGSVILADSGPQTMNTSSNDVWGLSINFTVRQVGVAGIAEIVTLGVFHTTKQANGVQTGFAFNTVNNTTFDTTIPNTLNVTAQFSSNSPLNSIYSDIFILNKIY